MRLALGFIIVAAVWAQDAPVFRTGTRLVQVDVVVHDKDGAVPGLTKDDFQVTDNGKTQTISIFSVRQVDSASPRVAPLPRGVVANRPQALVLEPVSATVVLIDRQNTYPEDQGYARLQALKYLERATRNEQIALYELGTTLRVLQQFTDDRDLLYKAMDSSKMEQSMNMLDAPGTGLLLGVTGNAAAAARANAERRRNDITTAAFATVARQLEGLPGRKKLIWITAALPLTFTQEVERNGITLTEFSNMSPQLFAAMKMLNDGNVALYPIDPRGPLVSLSDPGITTMIRLAEMTGGKAFYADNDLATGMDAAVSDTDVTYTLGYYVTEEVQDGGFHNIQVKVARPGVDVRYRRGYSAAKSQKPLTEKQRKGTLSAWVVEPLDATSLGIRGTARPVANRPGYYAVEVVVDPAELQLVQKNDRWVGAFDVAIVPNKGNKPKGLEQRIKVNLSQEGYLRALNTGIVVANAVKVTDGKGRSIAPELKVVVMDEANGKAGAVRIPVQ